MERIKRSVSLYAHATSVALEPEFWAVIDAYIIDTEQSLARFIAVHDDARLAQGYDASLSSYLRVWVVRQLTQTAPS